MPADVPQPINPPVTGHCPMGCGQTLTLSPDGAVTCSNTDCANPRAVRDILANPHTDHIVVLTGAGITTQHPLHERVESTLFGCVVHDAILAAGRSTLEDGTYQVIVTDLEAHPSEWTWERLA